MRYFVWVSVFILSFSFTSFAQTLYWFTGAGIKKPAQVIAKAFNKTHKNKVVIIAGGSGQVLNQIIQSKRGDIYTLVDVDFLKKAQRFRAISGYKKILKLTPIFLLSKDGEKKIKSFYDLAKDDIRIAGGNPRAMCLGKTFKQIISKLPSKMASKIQKNIAVRCLNVFQIVGYVKEGVVDAGIVLDKALIKNTHLKYITIPQRYNVNRYGYVALVSYSKNKKAQEELYNFILKHLYVYKKFGFEVIK
ncbi:molybdate ABC transporter substrate-binding protein [Hippea sp. KM1]|uniref:molybdate ABC transporter substrate-binding protein n=1 Tax=Hippea sp. KM1 TaxID=944481 RepID=UPI00046D4843|nr:molybdate ABC transporter substrate-binding protein [Hippea sp. KM1]